MTDSVLIEGLEVEAVIGVLEWERQIKQRLVFDLMLETDIQKAADNDDLQFTLDYAAISEAITHYVGSSEFKLIETLAEKVASLVLEQFSVSKLRLKVSKPGAVSNTQNVAIQIEREHP